MFIFSVAIYFEWMLWVIPLGWSRNLDLKKVSCCYYWHVFTWFRMECPIQIILHYFIFHVPHLNDKIGEWHCYSWNVSLKYASCCTHWSEKDLTDNQHRYLQVRKLSVNISGLFTEFLQIENFLLSQGPARKGINYTNIILSIFWIASLLVLEPFG